MGLTKVYIVKRNVVITATIKDDIGGTTDNIKIGVALVNGKAVAVHKHGVFRFSDSRFKNVGELKTCMSSYPSLFKSKIVLVDKEVNQSFLDTLSEDVYVG